MALKNSRKYFLREILVSSRIMIYDGISIPCGHVQDDFIIVNDDHFNKYLLKLNFHFTNINDHKEFY